jgi:hypothetical protein
MKTNQEEIKSVKAIEEWNAQPGMVTFAEACAMFGTTVEEVASITESDEILMNHPDSVK